MSGLKEEGGIGLRDLKNLNTTFLIKRATRLWKNETIWTSWIKHRYIKAWALDAIG